MWPCCKWLFVQKFSSVCWSKQVFNCSRSSRSLSDLELQIWNMLDQSLNSHWERTDREASAMRTLTASNMAANKRVPLACKVYKLCLNSLLQHRLDGSNKKQKGLSFWSSYLQEQLKTDCAGAWDALIHSCKHKQTRWQSWRLTLKHLCITILLQCLSRYCCNKYIIWSRNLYKMFSFRDKYKLNVWLLMWKILPQRGFHSYSFSHFCSSMQNSRQARTDSWQRSRALILHVAAMLCWWFSPLLWLQCIKQTLKNQKRHTETELSILFKCI